MRIYLPFKFELWLGNGWVENDGIPENETLKFLVELGIWYADIGIYLKDISLVSLKFNPEFCYTSIGLAGFFAELGWE